MPLLDRYVSDPTGSYDALYNSGPASTAAPINSGSDDTEIIVATPEVERAPENNVAASTGEAHYATTLTSPYETTAPSDSGRPLMTTDEAHSQPSTSEQPEYDALAPVEDAQEGRVPNNAGADANDQSDGVCPAPMSTVVDVYVNGLCTAVRHSRFGKTWLTW